MRQLAAGEGRDRAVLLDGLVGDAAVAGVEVIGDRGAVGRRVGRIPARLVEDYHAVAELEGLLEVVGDHEDGHLRIPLKFHQEFVHREPRAGVERAEGLVEEEDAGPGRQRLRDGEALLHSARKLRGPGVGHVAEADAVERGLRALPRRAAGCAGEKAEAGREGFGRDDVLAHGHVRENAIALKDNASFAARLGRGGAALDADRAARGLLLGEEKAQEGGLPAARGADDGDELAFRHGEVHALEDRAAGVALEDVADLHEGHAAPRRRVGKAYGLRMETVWTPESI
jgi:hypothetical protein